MHRLGVKARNNDASRGLSAGARSVLARNETAAAG